MRIFSGKLNASWGNFDELEFLKRIETFASEVFKVNHGKDTKVAMLREYIKTCSLRTNWCDMKRGVVTGFARTELARITK